MTAPSVSGGAILFALGSAACWGFGLVAAKASLDAGLPPTLLALVQLAVSVAALGIARPVVARASGGQSARTPIPLAAPLSGILEYAATGLIFAFGIALTTAGNAALIGAAEPAVIVVLAILLLGETAGRLVLSIEPTRLAFVQQAAGLVVLAPVSAMTLAFTGVGTLTLTAFALRPSEGCSRTRRPSGYTSKHSSGCLRPVSPSISAWFPSSHSALLASCLAS